jgi:hypothetical protein
LQICVVPLHDSPTFCAIAQSGVVHAASVHKQSNPFWQDDDSRAKSR